jgi:hypothetical protein
MSRFVTILAAIAGMSLSTCSTPNVKHSDLRPPATASVSADTLTVHVGGDLINSACFTKLTARFEGQTCFIVGYRALQEQTRDLTISLPLSVSSKSVAVVWIDPDGSCVPVPIAKL